MISPQRIGKIIVIIIMEIIIIIGTNIWTAN